MPQKSPENSGRPSFFSPVFLLLALLMGLTASVSSYFIKHLTVAGMDAKLVLTALLRGAALYILLVLLDFLVEAVRGKLLSRDAETAKGSEGSTRTKPLSRDAETAKGSGGTRRRNPPFKDVKEPKPAPSPASTFLLFFLVTLLALLPAFLALFPGYTAYDTPMQMEQFFTRGILNATQPIPLTLLFAGCLRLGLFLFHSANAGLLLHTLLQLFLTAACLSLTGLLFVRWNLKRRFALLLILLLELLPFVQIFALTTAKDAFFSPLFALWLALTADLFLTLSKRGAAANRPDGRLEDTSAESFERTKLDTVESPAPRTGFLIGYGLVSLLIILIRPQGKYLFLAAALLLLLTAFGKCVRAKKTRRLGETGQDKGASRRISASTSLFLRFASLAASVLLLSSLITGPLYRAAGVYAASPSEMLSVPIQQMTRVVSLHGDELSSGNLAAYDTYLDRSQIPTNYIPQISDLMKMSPVFDKASYAKDQKGFFSLWFRLLKQYPVEYADAFLYLTVGYFYQGIGYNHAWAGLAEEFVPGPSEVATHAVSLFPAYRSFLLENVGKTFAIKVPLLRRLCLISLPFWILACLGSLILRHRRPVSLILLLLLALYFGTLLLGPVCTVRYIIPLLYGVPVLAALLLTEKG